MTQNIKYAGKVIGFDLDGVIVDHTAEKIKIASEFGYKISSEETPSDIIKNVIPKEILKQILQKLYAEVSTQPLFAGAKEVLAELKASNIPFYLISRRRTGESRERAVEIMKKRGLWPEIFNEENVFFVEKPEEKNEVAKKLGVTHFIDDESNVLAVMTEVPNRFFFNNWVEIRQIII